MIPLEKIKMIVKKYQILEKELASGNIDKKDLRNNLKKVGDSLIVAGSTNRIHVHIHANKPAQVFSICERFE